MSETKLYILEIQRNFSKKLNQLLCRNGFYSKTKNIGNTNVLAKVAECSIPMARRYLLGKGIPSKKRLEKIAIWGNVSTNWFFDDEKGPSEEAINEGLLSEIILALKDQIFYTNTTDDKLKEYIKFSIEVYNQVQQMTSTESDKIHIAKIMIGSLSLTNKLSESKLLVNS